MRSVERKKISRRERVALSPASGPNQCWAADFVSDKLTDGRSHRILRVVDQFTRECIALEADRSLHGAHVVAALSRAIAERGATLRSGGGLFAPLSVNTASAGRRQGFASPAKNAVLGPGSSISLVEKRN